MVAAGGVMALTVLARRVAPPATALAGAAVLLLGAVSGMPVTDGFSFPTVVGLLLWSLLERRPTPVSLGSAALLFVAVDA